MLSISKKIEEQLLLFDIWTQQFHYQVATTAVNNILPSLLKKH